MDWLSNSVGGGFLKTELERELDDARRDAGAGDVGERWRSEFRIRVTKLWVIEGVEKLRAEFQERILRVITAPSWGILNGRRSIDALPMSTGPIPGWERSPG